MQVRRSRLALPYLQGIPRDLRVSGINACHYNGKYSLCIIEFTLPKGLCATNTQLFLNITPPTTRMRGEESTEVIECMLPFRK